MNKEEGCIGLMAVGYHLIVIIAHDVNYKIEVVFFMIGENVAEHFTGELEVAVNHKGKSLFGSVPCEHNRFLLFCREGMRRCFYKEVCFFHESLFFYPLFLSLLLIITGYIIRSRHYIEFYSLNIDFNLLSGSVWGCRRLMILYIMKNGLSLLMR